ncbi:MAG: hypothetical protein LBP76_01540 [Treponema sp.]|nr:hypothetical protein [Treponema sp.]
MDEKKITLYISEGGDDSNEGTVEKPLWSVAEALDRIRGKLYREACLIITGSVTEVSARDAMIDIAGKGLPVIYMQGGERPGILNAKGLNNRVMYISGGNKVYLGENLVIRGGITQGSGGAGITIEDGALFLQGAEISDNDAGFGMGGGVYVSGRGEFVMESGLITRNKTKMHGGGVFPDDGGKFIMRGGTISYNEAVLSGGGVFVGVDAEFTMSGGLIEKNQVGGEKIVKIAGVSVPYGQGGGVHVCQDARFTMLNGRICENRAIAVGREDSAGSGGGVFVATDGIFIAEKGSIVQNGVMNWGGGVYVKGSFTLGAACTIANNIARLGGGGVHVAGKQGVFTMKSGLLMNNYTGGKGGAVCVMEDSIFTMEGGLVTRNSAYQIGNAFAVNGLLTVNGGAVIDNVYPPPEESKEKDAETDTSQEKAQCVVVIDDTGKLVIHAGEIDGKIAMKKANQMEDLREKKEEEETS